MGSLRDGLGEADGPSLIKNNEDDGVPLDVVRVPEAEVFSKHAYTTIEIRRPIAEPYNHILEWVPVLDRVWAVAQPAGGRDGLPELVVMMISGDGVPTEVSFRSRPVRGEGGVRLDGRCVVYARGGSADVHAEFIEPFFRSPAIQQFVGAPERVAPARATSATEMVPKPPAPQAVASASPAAGADKPAASKRAEHPRVPEGAAADKPAASKRAEHPRVPESAAKPPAPRAVASASPAAGADKPAASKRAEHPRVPEGAAADKPAASKRAEHPRVPEGTQERRFRIYFAKPVSMNAPPGTRPVLDVLRGLGRLEDRVDAEFQSVRIVSTLSSSEFKRVVRETLPPAHVTSPEDKQGASRGRKRPNRDESRVQVTDRFGPRAEWTPEVRTQAKEFEAQLREGRPG